MVKVVTAIIRKFISLAFGHLIDFLQLDAMLYRTLGLKVHALALSRQLRFGQRKSHVSIPLH